VVAVEHVAIRIAVASDVAVELPVAPQLVSQQPGVGARRHAVDRIVAARALSHTRANFETESAWGI
jgi:hypothetical protein